jgi:hypothetical protein
MRKEVKIYKASVEKNLDNINSIIKKIGVQNPTVAPACREILTISSQNMTSKWTSGRKYVRTLFAQKAFANYYPSKQLELSLAIDGIINILDDLFDENMNKKVKALYIIELLRINSLYNLHTPPKNIQIAFGHYFNKLISLAVAEDCYQKQIKNENNINKIIKASVEIFSCRSQDIDIFNEIALVNYKNKKTANKIMEMGRI